MPSPSSGLLRLDYYSYLIPTSLFASAISGLCALEPLLTAGSPGEASAQNLVHLLAQNGRYADEVEDGVKLETEIGPIPPDEDLLAALEGHHLDPLRSQDALAWHVRRVLNSPRLLPFLPPGKRGYMAGGCGMLALALTDILGPEAQVAGLITSNKGLMHVLTKLGDAYIDADGVWTHEEAVTKNPMGPQRWIELDITNQKMQAAAIKLPVRKTAALSAALEELGLGAQILSVLVPPSLEL